MFMLQTLTVLSLNVIFLASVEGNGVQMQRDVQCCMLYSQGKVRTKDVLRFEVQTEGPDCSIQAIMQAQGCMVQEALSSFQVILLWQNFSL
ncbi:hypothetical protein GOODEAATRI_017273 [Goodea atripinnis]|uniref:Chemokine interleukin-8-like domain-containing protein n=1 Tax=Goodea atripinnis TaxID=208336 RepID=A0ABV0NVA9_9TELE